MEQGGVVGDGVPRAPFVSLPCCCSVVLCFSGDRGSSETGAQENGRLRRDELPASGAAGVAEGSHRARMLSSCVAALCCAALHCTALRFASLVFVWASADGERELQLSEPGAVSRLSPRVQVQPQRAHSPQTLSARCTCNQTHRSCTHPPHIGSASLATVPLRSGRERCGARACTA